MACDQSRLRLAAEEQKPEAKKEKKNEDEDEERRLVEKRIHDLQKEVSVFPASFCSECFL